MLKTTGPTEEHKIFEAISASNHQLQKGKKKEKTNKEEKRKIVHCGHWTFKLLEKLLKAFY